MDGERKALLSAQSSELPALGSDPSTLCCASAQPRTACGTELADHNAKKPLRIIDPGVQFIGLVGTMKKQLNEMVPYFWNLHKGTKKIALGL